MKRAIVLLASAFFALALMLGTNAHAQAYADCQRVVLKQNISTLDNQGVVCVYNALTALDSINTELNELTSYYDALYTPALQALDEADAMDARLDIGIQYSRTGTSWLSFLIYARITRGDAIGSTAFTTRTYNMLTGERVTLTTLFDEKSTVWNILQSGVRKAFLRYYPDLTGNTRVTDQLLVHRALYTADFTLHGMSLVLHYPASTLFEGKSAIIQVPFYYPELYGHMRSEAYEQTDNRRYYQMACLTFNDGPSSAATPRLLAMLAKKGVRASFFITGSRIARTAAIVQRERDEGHAVGGHNWLHTDTSAWPKDAVRAIRARLDAALTEATGAPSAYNRTPYGKNEPLLNAKTGWALIEWSVNSGDLYGGSPQAIARHVRSQAMDGDIILCHDTTLRCDIYAELIIDALESDGYLFLTVDEMFAKDRVPFLGDLVYYRCAEGVFSMR